ncbi:MAG: hypothetical protein ABI723_05020 [Bacteroidia bacterium]
MTTSHKNFAKGFWFATEVAGATIDDKDVETNKVVCIDCTKRGVLGYLKSLIEKINNG